MHNNHSITAFRSSPSVRSLAVKATRGRFAATLIVVGLALAACGSDEAGSSSAPTPTVDVSAADGAISIADPWSRQPAEGQTLSAVYGMVTNATDEAVTAVGATTDVAGRVELHQVTMNDEGQMSMSEKEGGYTIGAGETFVFEPGGPHIMLFDVDAATYPDTIDMTLEFDNGETLDFTAEVRAIDGDDATEIDGATDGEMGTDEG